MVRDDKPIFVLLPVDSFVYALSVQQQILYNCLAHAIGPKSTGMASCSTSRMAVESRHSGYPRPNLRANIPRTQKKSWLLVSSSQRKGIEPTRTAIKRSKTSCGVVSRLDDGTGPICTSKSASKAGSMNTRLPMSTISLNLAMSWLPLRLRFGRKRSIRFR
ncbi:hypothetical protein CTAM01_17151 [Colletotrichum tamarilloi]|uniref:Uncharacterized protein n=1 Tax=Colletotrichum tamarilloi TaxID=1209934 RepID=A0ABQ9QGG2_9PEZI|nr:uncharacterized protein CTAM01_17151 [Colletotrichum tamarilloi]KAK1458730.1 hypothetical protein CTAM01_17151 [Colletotrichum tamarilloi]